MATENTNSLIHIDLRGVSEIGKTLIDHVAKLIGGGLAPYQIKRIAEAQADAALVKATSDIHVQALHQRASLRTAEEEVRHQHNMEAIAIEAAKEVTDPSETKPDEDWLNHFFQHARHISSNDTQHLWGKILANEFQQPGQVSKKLLDILRSLDAQDATLFQKICEYAVVRDDEPVPLFPGKSELHKIQEKSGITVARVKDLEAVGLMNLVTFRMGGTPLPQSGSYHFKIGRSLIEAHTPESPKPKAGVDLGLSTFTKYGKELFHIVNIEPPEEFKKYFKNHILKAGYSTSEPLDSDPADWSDDKKESDH